MPREVRNATPATTQGNATAPRPVDPDGRTLDAWGLPLNGPARLRALGDKPDPRDDPAAVPATPADTQD